MFVVADPASACVALTVEDLTASSQARASGPVSRVTQSSAVAWSPLPHARTALRTQPVSRTQFLKAQPAMACSPSPRIPIESRAVKPHWVQRQAANIAVTVSAPANRGPSGPIAAAARPHHRPVVSVPGGVGSWTLGVEAASGAVGRIGGGIGRPAAPDQAKRALGRGFGLVCGWLYGL